MNIKEYIGFIFTEEQTGIYIGVVPDLNFTSSHGRTFKEASDSLKEACELYSDDKELPNPTDFDVLMDIPEIPEKHIVVYIKVPAIDSIDIIL